MATKSVYQPYDIAALKHYGLEGTPEYGVLSSSGEIEKAMFTSNDDVYKKIKSALETNTLDDTTFRTKKKAFILPLCPVSQDRIKAALKEHKITVTNDYETADFIITHNDFSRDFRNGEPILTTAMLATVWNYEILLKTKNGGMRLDNWITNCGTGIIFDDKVTAEGHRSYMCETQSAIYDRYMITGLALNIAYQIELGNYGVIDAEAIVNASSNKITLTEELVTDLCRYMNSSNQDDREIAGKIIPTIDYTCNFHLLWHFAQESYSRMYVFNKNKDVQYWMEISGYSNFKYKEALEMIKWLEENNKLDNVSFKYLERIVRKEIRIENRDLYIFKVELKPQYKKYYGKQTV